ncbi:sigma-70 family RNA polymerase sigma factor [Caryophanon latum]|uniref:RNA polymerase sigma-70 domain-containing protein n=1 Tax=Caryophanon latum TaxID=33977 RepID=A0A1C0YPV8_9BACL|nr:sigma-70 family RNA polymerase sigma factor [Caryophanon latum]OCS89191.1 hypothetical protein A6K76_12615 [Caryophanon latum]
MDIEMFKDFLKEKYPIKSHQIQLQDLKNTMISYFRGEYVEINDEDLKKFLASQGYTNLIDERDEENEFEDDEEDDLTLASFFENDFDPTDLLLKAGTYKDNRVLFEENREKRIADKELIEKIVQSNAGLVQKIAQRYVGIAKSFTFEDLINEGHIGLIKAIKKYDVSLGYEFSTYATHWIRQSITRALADKANIIRIPVHMNERISKINKIERELEFDNPTIDDICELAEISEEQYMAAKEAEHRFLHDVSLNSNVSSDSDLNELIDLIIGTEENYDIQITSVEEVIVNRSTSKVLKKVLEELKDREREIIEYRFGFKDGEIYTLEEVGKHFDVTRERIRQIEAKALRKLKNKLYLKELLEQ